MKKRILFLLTVLCFLISGCTDQKSIEMENYLLLSFNGDNGKGTLQLQLDKEALSKDYPGFSEEDFHYTISKEEELSNGEEIIVEYSYKDKDTGSVVYTVRGLEAELSSLKEIDETSLVTLREKAAALVAGSEVKGLFYLKDTNTLYAVLSRNSDSQPLYAVYGIADHIYTDAEGLHYSEAFIDYNENISELNTRGYSDLKQMLYSIRILESTYGAEYSDDDIFKTELMEPIGKIKVVSANPDETVTMKGFEAGNIIPVYDAYLIDGVPYYQISETTVIHKHPYYQEVIEMEESEEMRSTFQFISIGDKLPVVMFDDVIIDGEGLFPRGKYDYPDGYEAYIRDLWLESFKTSDVIESRPSGDVGYYSYVYKDGTIKLEHEDHYDIYSLKENSISYEENKQTCRIYLDNASFEGDCSNYSEHGIRFVEDLPHWHFILGNNEIRLKLPEKENVLNDDLLKFNRYMHALRKILLTDK